MKTIVTIIGTRPEIIKLSCIINSLDRHFNHILIHTHQNWDYSLSEIFFDEMNIRKPNYILSVIGDNLGNTIGNIISQTYNILSEINPDGLVILGDTNSGLSAICAKRLKIPIFHLEAGNRCFDENVPEEINRKIIDHISDINFVYTEHGKINLLNEGIRNDKINIMGSPLFEVYLKYKDNIEKSDILNTLHLTKNDYFLLSCHREENVDNKNKLNNLINILNNVAVIYDKRIIFSCHPRTRKKLLNIKTNDLIEKKPPFGYFDYCKLQKNALCVISDSGTLSEEACILDFKGILIRTSTERQESLDTGNIIVAGIGNSILDAIDIIINTDVSKIPVNYLNNDTSTKIVRNIQSYFSLKNNLE